MNFRENADWLLERLESYGATVRELLLSVVADVRKQRENPNSLLNRFNRFWRILWLIIVALAAAAIVGCVARNAWLISVPILLIMVLVDLFLALAINSLRPITAHADRRTKPPFDEWCKLTKEEKKEWKKEYSTGGALKLIEQGIQGRLFWIALTVTWAFITRPWQGGWLGSTSFAVLLLFWTFNHLCKFLDTLRIASKITMFVFVILLLISSIVQKTNNPLVLLLKGKLDYWSSKTEVNRVFDKQRAKANHVIAQGVATPIQDSVFLVAPGAPLRGESGVIGYYAGTPLYLLKSGKQEVQPSVLLGTHWHCYLPDAALSKIDEKAVPTISSQTTKDFLLYDNRLVWVNVDYLSPVVEVKQPPKLKVLKPGEAANLTENDDLVNNSSKQNSSGAQRFLAAGNKIRWGAFLAVAALIAFGYWAAGKWLKPTHQTSATLCRAMAIFLICLAAWSYIIGPFGQAALAGESRQKVPTLPVKLTGQNMPEPRTPEQMPQYGGRVILTSSQELFNGLTLTDVAGSKIYWHRYGWIRKGCDEHNNSHWTPFLPFGNYYIEGRHRSVKRFAGNVSFQYPQLPAYCAVIRLSDDTGQEQVVAWRGDTGNSKESDVDIDVLDIAADVSRVLITINAPTNKQEVWQSDQGSIVLEVVK